MTSLSRLKVICVLSTSLLLVSPDTTGIQPFPTKEASSISIYDDESALPLFQHHSTVALFLGEKGFGADRSGVSLISHATLDPYVMAWSDNEGAYDAQIIDLIGLLQAPKSRVYATMQDLYARNEMPAEDPDPTTPEERAAELRRLKVPNLPLTTIQRNSRQKKDWKVRELDSFETKALGLLKTGHALVWKDQGTSFRAVGAIRMQANCARCHEDKNNGDLLGAFTYFGFKSPRPPDEDREYERKIAEFARQDPFSKEFIDARNNHHLLNDTDHRDEWPVPQERVFYIDRALAHKGIVTPGMLKRLKALLARLPRDKDEDEATSADK